MTLFLDKRNFSPQSPLIDSVQIWVEGEYLFIRYHAQADPGSDEITKIRIRDDNLKVEGGLAYSVSSVSAGSQTIDMQDKGIIVCSVTSNCNFVPQGGVAGQFVTFVFTSTGAYKIQFSPPFISTGEKYLYNGQIFVTSFVYDGTYWYEITNDTKFPRRNTSFVWAFKMVSIDDYATPLAGASPSVMISRGGASFSELYGSPPVTEIGYGWYSVVVPASDMNYDFVILKASATGGAQTDRVIFLG